LIIGVQQSKEKQVLIKIAYTPERILTNPAARKQGNDISPGKNALNSE